MFKKIIDKINSLDTGTKVRTLISALAYINQIVALIGMNSYAMSPVYQWISFGLTIVISIVSYWFNNDWTEFAQLAGTILDMLQDGKITAEEVWKFVEKHNKPTVKKKEENEQQVVEGDK